MSMLLCKTMKFQIKKIVAVLTAVIILTVTLSGCSGGDITPPKNADAQASDNGIIVSWEYDGNADSFKIFRKTENESNYKYLDDATECSYIDSTAKIGVYYSYSIKALCDEKISDSVSTQAVIINAEQTVANSVPSRVSVLSVTRMDKFTNVIEIGNLQAGCSYEISRADAAGGSYTVIGNTDGKYFYDETAENKPDCFYKATAINSVGKSAESSAVKVGTNARSVFNVPVLMYHEFVTQQDLDSGVAFDEYAIYKQEFESDLAWLKSNGYTTVTSEELLSYMKGEATPPQKPVILTIDDGKYGVYKNAYPLLKKYNMKAVLSVIGYEIDNATANPDKRSDSAAPYCTWYEIGEMSKSGFVEIISHTQTLHYFDHDGRQGANVAEGETADEYSDTAQLDFIKINKSIKDATGKHTVAMAYPYSKRSDVADKAWLESGYKILYSGDDDNERLTRSNYFVAGADSNPNSALLRRIARMTGTSAQEYILEIINQDK